MIDIHSHVLPGIDDGAESLREAVEMCRGAAEAGCAGVIATPHLRHARWWNGELSTLQHLHAEVRRHLSSQDDPELYLGGEIALHSESVEEIYEMPEGELPTLAGSRYVLIEFDWHGLGPDVLEVVHELRVKGLFPIIAHPERYRWLAGQPELFEKLVERGAYLQLTAMSVTGRLGPDIQRLCQDLLRHELVHFVASDMHDTQGRPPGLQGAREQIQADFGPKVARRIFDDNPRALVADQPLDSRSE